MTRHPRPDDRTLDAVFSGQVPPGCEDLADVAAFASRLRTGTSALPIPGPELAAVLAHGLSTAGDEVPVRAGSGAAAPALQGPVPSDESRERKVFPLALAKLGLVAKTSLASAAVLAATTGAAAADLLPPQAQDAVAGAIEAVTPFDLPDSADPAADDGLEIAEDAGITELEDVADEARPEEPGDEARPEEPGDEGRETATSNAGEDGQEGRDTAGDAADRGSTFGADTADDARENGDDASNSGPEIAEEARERAPDVSDAPAGIPDVVADEGAPENNPADDAGDNVPEDIPSGDGSDNVPADIPSGDGSDNAPKVPVGRP